jgi:hypothetical protein
VTQYSVDEIVAYHLFEIGWPLLNHKYMLRDLMAVSVRRGIYPVGIDYINNLSPIDLACIGGIIGNQITNIKL